MGLLLLAGLTVPASATQQRLFSLAEMTAAAERILVGRVTSVRVSSPPAMAGETVTQITLRVSESWKGPSRPTHTFIQFGDASRQGHPVRRPDGRWVIERFEGLPTYRVGEEVLLFLRRPSDLGLTSPVGFTAGKIGIRRDPETGQAILMGGPAELRRGPTGRSRRVSPHGGAPAGLTWARSRVAELVRRGGRE
jgi:hypothetical protein